MRKYYAFFCLISFGYSVKAQQGFRLVEVPSKKKVEVRYDEKLLTAYCFFDSTEKPVLFPIKTVSGVTITRGYPVAPRTGERTDHPHHLGLWMNYESVNGLDFWNNSSAISPEKKSHYGSIRHKSLIVSQDKEHPSLETISHWVNQEGLVLLEEKTLFVFTIKDSDFIIDRIATLEAKAPEVLFKDVKDGMLGLRVARELEMPSKESSKFVDASGNVTEVSQMDNSKVTGMYTNHEGIMGDDVWGKRSQWACLSGKKDGEGISIAIIDHPKNEGYPTYWHARGYGLFAANPLGQKVFSGGKEELNLTLKSGERKVFRYRIIIHSGNKLTEAAINNQMVQFSKLY